jgi:hypothetical protein
MFGHRNEISAATTPPLGAIADSYRPSPETRIVALLDGGIRGVHVDVNDHAQGQVQHDHTIAV